MAAKINDKKVEDFMNLTGAPLEVAKTLLEACCGNLELAIGMHLDSNVPQLPSENRGLEERVVPVSNSSYEDIHGIRAPIPSTQGILIEQEAPPTRRTFQRKRMPQSVFDPFQDFSELPSSSKKHQTLAELFKPPTDIMFHGTFQEARRCGQTQNKWLLVNLQDSREFNCQVLNRDIWRNMTVRKIIKDNFIFLQLQRITDDGAKFQVLYNVDTFPSIVIIDPRTGERMTNLNDVTLSSFIEQVQEFLAFNTLNHQQEQSLEQSSVYDQTESQQLEAAIRASMYEQTAQTRDSDSDCLLTPEDDSDDDDRGDDNTLSSFNSNYRTTSNDNHQLEVSKRKRLEDFTSELPPSKQWCSSNNNNTSNILLNKRKRSEEFHNELPSSKQLCPSNSQLHDEDSSLSLLTTNYPSLSSSLSATSDSSNSVCTTTLLIRYPDGRRSVRSFNADSPIKELFLYLREEGITLTTHEIITTFPRTLVSSLSQDITFRQAKLFPRQTIYIQTTEDDNSSTIDN